MKQPVVLVGIVLLASSLNSFALSGSLPAERSTTEPVHFAKGATSTVLKGKITGSAIQDYRVGARAGQQLTVALSANASVNFNILPPGSDGSALYNSALSGESRHTLVLPQDGDYLIRVYQLGNRKHSGQTSPFRLTLALPAQQAGAAPLPSHYSASGRLECAVRPTPLDERCDFRVVRGERQAELWVAKPGGADPARYRELTFARDRVTTPDGSAVQAQRISDNWKVSVGEREHYFIPDATLFGG